MGIWRVDHRVGLALILLPAVCVAEPKKAEPIKPVRRLKAGNRRRLRRFRRSGPVVPLGHPVAQAKPRPANRPQPNQSLSNNSSRSLGYINSNRTHGPILMNEGLPRHMLD